MDEKITSNKSDDASKRPLKKKKKKVAVAVKAPVSLGDPEMDAIFAKIYSMKDDLDSKFSRVREISGMSGQEISNYLNNPNNFTPYQWERMERDKKQVEEKLYLGLGKDAKEKKAKKTMEKQAKERRGKMLGARKKWLQM